MLQFSYIVRIVEIVELSVISKQSRIARTNCEHNLNRTE